nr:YdaU family protein [Burkholderia ambifaria]
MEAGAEARNTVQPAINEEYVSDLPDPLTPADCDLRDFPFMPLDIARLFNSEFHARSDDAVWRVGVTLWLKSFHQVPAASVPDDDIALTRLAELGRDVKTWKKLRNDALYGWTRCSDGRWYHPVVAEKVLEAWNGKKAQRARTAKARLQALITRLSQAKDAFDAASIETSVQTLLASLSSLLSLNEYLSVEKSVTESLTEAKRKREGKEKGEGQGKEKPTAPDGAGAKAPSEPGSMTKDELWAAGKSLLTQAGLPAAQCGSFVGKLVKDYGDKIAIEAVRTAVVERPADAVSFLKATCQTLAGQRGRRGAPAQADIDTENAKAKELLFGKSSEAIDV